MRSRVIAETLTDLGVGPVVVTTREPGGQPSTPPSWARRLLVPARKPIKAFSPGFARLIREASKDATVLIITNAMFLPAVALSRCRLPIVWDTNECQTLHYRRLPFSWANRAKYVIWFVLEHWAARRCQVAIAIGATEATVWRDANPALAGKLAVVDHAAFATLPAGEPRAILQRLAEADIDGPVLLFLGTLRAKQNLAAVAWILHELLPALPSQAWVVLCGPGTEDVELPAADAGAARVVALGTVDDVDAVVAAADICLAPLASGAGVKTKVLHYLAHTKAVAGTPAAFEGLPGVPGVHVADLDSLPKVIAELCQEAESEVAASARRAAQAAWLEDHHGRGHIRAQWQQVLDRLAAP